MAVKHPSVTAANKYARDVVAGRIAAGRYVRLTCQRQLDDLKNSKLKKYPYKFDAEKAERILAFVQLLPHTKGEWAFKKQLIDLEPWQCFVFAVAFGWVHKKTGNRRFREAYNEVPRKNGKSVLGSGVGLYMFAAADEFGAEVYSGATSEKQAWEVFRPARLMAKRTPYLCEKFGIEVNAKSLVRHGDGARFEPLIGNPGDGQSPSCALIDEYHEHRTDALYTTMLSGMGARSEPMVYTITTAGYDIESPCYDKRRAVIDMLEGTTPDPQLFGIIYTIDDSDDWTDPAVLRKANPNMGVSVYEDYLYSQQQRAINNPRFVNTFKTKHLNVWVSSKEAFFNMVDWGKCEDTTLTLDQFEGHECYLGLDLARKLDFNSMARLFVRMIDGKRHYYSVGPRFWVPEDTVFKTDNKKIAERYQTWVNTGDLLTTDGAEIDYREILAECIDANLLAPINSIGIDPHGATGLSHDLDDEGLNPVTIVQNYTNLSDPMKELEAAITAGRFHHDGHPLITWCLSNVVGKNIPGNDDVVRPTKETNDAKIDGAVALIMAVGRAMLAEDETSVYETEELLIL